MEAPQRRRGASMGRGGRTSGSCGSGEPTQTEEHDGLCLRGERCALGASGALSHPSRWLRASAGLFFVSDSMYFYEHKLWQQILTYQLDCTRMQGTRVHSGAPLSRTGWRVRKRRKFNISTYVAYSGRDRTFMLRSSFFRVNACGADRWSQGEISRVRSSPNHLRFLS